MPDKTPGEILHEARIAGGEQRPRPWPPESWADRDPKLKALDEAMAAAVEAAVRVRLRTHEHEWTRCPECKQPGQPCPCSGTACCEMERREIVAANEAAKDERERVAAHIEAIAANYPEDVFPPDSGSRDAISGTAMRHAYKNAAREIREGVDRG